MTSKSDKEYCSECFHDYGLRKMARDIGRMDGSVCNHCRSTMGCKLNLEQLWNLAGKYFVSGSYNYTDFGGAEVFQIRKNTPREYLSDVENELEGFHFTDDLKHDIDLFNRIGIIVFPNAPRLCKIGVTEWFDKLNCVQNRQNAIEEIVDRLHILTITEGTKLYRIRKEPESLDACAFDAPPSGLQKLDDSRFNIEGGSVLYTAFSPSTCIYESKVQIRKPYTLATYSVLKQLVIKDLTNIDNSLEETDEFQQLQYTLNQICFADQISYDLTHCLAETIKKKGFDGIIYPSYYNQERKSTKYKNLALFGHPVQNEQLGIESIDNIRLTKVSYGFSYGPAYEQECE